MAKKTQQYGNSSISMLKGEERVRKRPAVIFGSDDLEGASTQYLRSYPTPSTRLERDTAIPSSSPATPTSL